MLLVTRTLSRVQGSYPAEVARPVSARKEAPAGNEALHSTATATFELLSWVIRLMPRDITLTSLFTLGTLLRSGPRRITELAASEGISQPSMTVLVTSLERFGLVERRSDPADRRVVLVAITDAGSDFFRTRRDGSAQTIARAIAELSPKEASTLAAAAPVLERLGALLELERSKPAATGDDSSTR